MSFVDSCCFKPPTFYSSIKTMKNKDLYLILHNIRSAYNVGAIFRTADAVGVKKIFLCGYTPCPTIDHRLSTNDKIHKTALGAEKSVPWEQYKQTWRLLKRLKDNGLWLIALEQAKNSKNIFAHKPPQNRNIALILGNEVRGLSGKILNYVDEIMEIPMYGKKESLNVSVAAGIVLYQLIK